MCINMILLIYGIYIKYVINELYILVLYIVIYYIKCLIIVITNKLTCYVINILYYSFIIVT